ncbi:hypothetical protein OPQ81_006565 [Rhizoctonia solani]|nr:hypothetical protein OPQ81_006565 [Rhizoctonia solani]
MRAIEQKSSSSVENTSNQPQFRLKGQGGVIRPEIRDMLRKLACQGVSTERASRIIDIVADGLGVKVLDKISARSVGRIMLEGLVQACMQLAQELLEANTIAICGDGTSIKNQQHEARAIFMKPPSTLPEGEGVGAIALEASRPVVLRTLGVHKASSHTAQKQLEGWISAINRCCDVWNHSPQELNQRINSHMVAPKLRGVLTDHAADQKRFYELLREWKQRCDREARAVELLKTMTVEEQLCTLTDYLDNAATNVSNWRLLPSDQQAALMHDAWFALAIKTGEAEFQKLSQDAQFDVDFLAWAGCCMHKELNAVKGGVTKMALAWEANGLKRPMPLYNKFDAEKAMKGHNEKAPRGGPKLARISGDLFKNKEDKKGYQKSVDNYFETVFGYSNHFPDISNTRYGSHCDAATELILHLNTYIKLLETLRDAKVALEFTNIESNLFRGLHDIPTLTELAVMALYAQAIGRPYLRFVRSTKLNALDLGIFHKQVKKQCRAIIEKPDILLGQDASAERGSLDGGVWDRPEVVYRISWMSHKLPDLRTMLVAFFEGALETWERFTSEFKEGGVIAQATQEQRDMAWVTPTNDISEGLLGQCRQMLRRAPTMTDEQLNARLMWGHNGTYEWAKRTLNDASAQFVRQEARNIDTSGANRKLRTEFTTALEAKAVSNRERQAKAVERRSEVKRRLDQVQIIENATYKSLYAMKVKDLDLQIDKLREAGDPYIRAKSTIGTKAAKIQEVLACLERRRGTAGIYTGINSDELDLINTSGRETGEDEVDMYFDDETVL